MLNVIIPISILRAVWRFAGKGDVRPHLNFVYFEQTREALFVVGCNGMSMGVVTMNDKGDASLAEGEKRTLLFDPREFKTQLNKKDINPLVIVDQESEDQVKLVYGGASFLCQLQSFPFPNWRRIIPEYIDEDKNSAVVDFNQVNTAEFVECLFFNREGKSTKDFHILKYIRLYSCADNLIAFEQTELNEYPMRGVLSKVRGNEFDGNLRDTMTAWRSDILAVSSLQEQLSKQEEIQQAEEAQTEYAEAA